MELAKVLIESFKDAGCTKPVADGHIYAFINPTSYTKSVQIEYISQPVINDPGKTFQFSKFGEQSLKMGEFIVDGTGLVNNNPYVYNNNVDGYVERFQAIVSDYIGEIHGPPFLKISWGNMSFVCICENFTVKYTLFNPDGTGLRAEITLSLLNTVDWNTKVQEAGNSSPDLTHLRTVQAGDTLPLMTYQIYGDSAYYMDVARINKLTHINDIKPGDQLYFPPLKK